MGRNGKKPATTLLAERAEEETKKAKAAELLGPQKELPGPPEAPTGEQIAAKIQDWLASGPVGFGDLVLWTRERFGTSMEVAFGLVRGEIELGTVHHEEHSSKCYTVASLEALALGILKGCDLPLTEVSGCVDEEIGATADSEAATRVDLAIQGLIDRGALLSIVKDGEPWLSLAPVPILEAIAQVAESHPDLVENAGTPESDAKEAHADARDLRQDSKRLVSVMDKLRRRKSLKDSIASLKEELKELQDEMKGIDAELDGIGRDGDKAIEPSPATAPNSHIAENAAYLKGEPEDVALPFEDPAFSEEDSEEPATPEPDGAAAALVN